MPDGVILADQLAEHQEPADGIKTFRRARSRRFAVDQIAGERAGRYGCSSSETDAATSPAVDGTMR